MTTGGANGCRRLPGDWISRDGTRDCPVTHIAILLPDVAMAPALGDSVWPKIVVEIGRAV